MTVLAEPGSISSGTLRPQDLLCNFATALEILTEGGQREAEMVGVARRASALPEDYYGEYMRDVLGTLFVALDSYSPPGYYFGAHPGDGADFGFWSNDTYETDDVLSEGDLYGYSGTSCSYGHVLNAAEHVGEDERTPMYGQNFDGMGSRAAYSVDYLPSFTDPKLRIAAAVYPFGPTAVTSAYPDKSHGASACFMLVL